jgi:hypothetical protein
MYPKLFLSSIAAILLPLGGTAVAQYTTVDVGTPQPAGTVTPSGNGYNITAGGGDIGGTIDQFTFNYQTMSGDFDIRIRVNSLLQADSWTKAALMGRGALSTNSAFAAVVATPGVSGAYFSSRASAGVVAANVGTFPVNYPNTWLRLRRVGSQFTGFASLDGNSWVQLGTANVSMADPLFVGMAVTSRTNGVTTTAQFRDSGTVTGGVVVPYALDVEPPGPSSRLTPFAFTEIMYNPFPSTNASGQPLEFVELYNSNPFFEDISGYRLSGDIDFTFPPNTVLQGGAYLVVARDLAAVKSHYGLSDFNGYTGVIGSYSNSLPGTGTLRLRNKENAVLLEVPYSSQPPWPTAADGAGHSLVLARPSYGERDPFAWAISDKVGGSPGGFDTVSSSPQRSVVINEFLANSDPPDVDFIELYNHSNQEVDLSGCSLSDDPHTNKFVFPSGTSIPARGFLAFDQNEFGFGLSSGGETIYFRNADGTRVLDAIRFDAQATGISSGRSPDGAREIYPLAARTPGAANSAIRIHDIVINEIMYRPVTSLDDDEYVELYNKGTNTISLAGWKFIAGISYMFPTNAALAPDSYLVVAKNVSRLITNYANLNSNNTYGNFKGSLRNRGDRVALAYPDTSITTNAMNEVKTNTVHVVVDEVTYRNGGNWPKWANEGGSSMELIDPRSNHRLAHNWTDSDETQKAPWSTVEATGNMDNGSDAPNWAEILGMGEGEYLVDNYEIIHSSGTTNYLSAGNSTFESGVGNWLFRGTHRRSTIEPSGGFGGGQCLHLRTTDRGDTMGNRALCNPIPSVPNSGSVTMRAKVRWLRGWPEILLRLKGNWMEAFGRLTLPPNLGTPGQRNSATIAAQTNAPPAIYEVKHTPVVPAANEPVLVTARVHDPDGVQSVVLKYRVDTSGTQTSVNMLDNGTGGDAVANDGIYTGTIPGQAADTMIAFQVTATDSRNATRVFPLQYPNYNQPFECLVRFGDPVISSSFASYRQWMSSSNVAFFSSPDHPALSNERVFETLVYGNFRAIYNTVMKWAGSPYHQFSGSPVTTAAHYVIDIPSDDLFLGTDSLSKIHAPGNGPFDDNTAQREQFSYWMARQLGLPWNYRRSVNMFFNGNRRNGTTSLMEDSVTPGGDVVDAYFPDDSAGDLYKLQPWFEQGDPSSGANNRAWTELDKFTTLSNGVPVHKTGRYRNNFLVRAAHGTANDFAPVFELIDAAQPTNNLPAQFSNLTKVAEMEEWFRIFAVTHSIGDWDHVGYRNAQNIYGYRGKNTKWTFMIWDMNIVLDNSGSDGASSLTLGGNLTSVNAADSVMPFLYRNPPFRRMYLRALKEICTSVWVTNNYIPVLDSKYNAMLASGITPTSPNAQVKPYISTARSTILNSIRNEDATNGFLITSTSPLDTTNNYVVLIGQAPVEARTILVNGIEYPITWTSAKNFLLYVPLDPGSTTLTLQGYDIKGNPLAGFSTNITSTFTGQVPPPESSLVISEIMYNPANPDASFVEIYNNSDFAYDLSGWRVNGIDYRFPDAATITNRQYLVLAKNVGGFAAAYPNSVIYDLFDGNLDNGGETLSLEKPVPVYTTNGATIVTNILYTPVNRVRYDDDPPWPVTADGHGPSLQLIDPNQDNARVSNWGAGAAWLRVSRTGNIANGTNLLLWLTQAGNCYVDDISLVGPDGTNIVVNGGFESGTFDPWIVGTNYTSSFIADNISHSGIHSLFLNGAGPGGSFPLNLLQQVIGPTVQISNTYTLTFYVLFNTNAVTVNMRTLPGNNLTTNFVTAPIQFSPGQASFFADTLPPYDPLWLNEIQINNLTGIMDNNNQRDPWVELFNSGTNTLDLSGYFLANNYDTNLTQWQFPAGVTIGPRSFRVVWLDGESAQTSGTNLHANFRANSSTGSVALVRFAKGKPQITDYLNYPVIGPDLSYGSAPDGQPFNRTILFSPTPGSSNAFRVINVFINEWMAGNTNFIADPADGQFDDWFELYNAGSQPVDLSGFWLTDNLNNHMGYQVPTNGQYVIPPGEFLLVWADGEPNQNSASRPDLHVNFQLSRTGESIGLYAPDGQTVIDAISFGAQTNDVSEGRFADGANTIYFMTTPTPRAPNTIGLGNTQPSLAPISDKTVTLGQTLSFMASASDPDFPVQMLTFSLLPGAPAGAMIDATAGLFTWTPNPAQAPSTNSISVRVTDSGAPPLGANRSFIVTVRLPPQAMISNSGNGKVSLSFDALNGKTYRVEYKNNLDDAAWVQLGDNILAAGNSVSVNDDLGASPQRFYRIVQLD